MKMKILKSLKNFFTVYLVILYSIFHILYPSSVFAARFSAVVSDAQIRTGDSFESVIYLDTQGETVNAVEGTISFPTNLLTIQEIRTGNSVVNFWIDPPRAGDSGIISFSGVLPGGYYGSDGKLFSIIFEAVADGSGTIAPSKTKALLNDGTGTAARVVNANAFFSISNQFPESSGTFLKTDTTPPEPFTPHVGQDPALFNNHYFLVFSTTDKGVGIDHYEVAEITSGSAADAKTDWHIAVSPYLLIDQTLHADIQVRAVDQFGNTEVATVPAKFRGPVYRTEIANTILGIIAALGVLLLWKWRKRRKHTLR